MAVYTVATQLHYAACTAGKYMLLSTLDFFCPCSLIVGDNLNVKGALGMPNVALYADAAPGYDSAWCSNADHWPTASTTTGSAVCARSAFIYGKGRIVCDITARSTCLPKRHKAN